MRNLFTDSKEMGKHARESFARNQLTSRSQIIKLAATLLTEKYGQKHRLLRSEMVW